MKNSQKLLLTFAMLAAMSSVLAAQDKPQPTNAGSAKSSPPSATVANRDAVLAACANAARDLAATRKLVAALDDENKALNERLATERQLTTTLAELNATRKSESEALRTAITAKDETIAAKNSAIDAQAKLIENLKRKRTSILGRISGVIAGAAVALLLVR
ncbi:MAG: hypothetical protein JNL64_01425 [Blastocatellia bacterium]|nr:hypothetical protein [Blastocatellia bacterium]